MQFKPGSINIPTSAGPRNATKAWNIIASETSVFGTQEALYPHIKGLELLAMRRAGWKQYGLYRSPNPIFWDPEVWQFVDGGVTRLHGRGPNFRRYPGFNASRKNTWVTLHHRETDHVVTFINVHWVPQGPKVPESFRQFARARSLGTTTRQVNRFRDEGHHVVVFGDTNIPDKIFLGPRPVWLKRTGVDKMVFFLGGVDGEVHTRIKMVPAPVDHKDGIVGMVTIP